LAENTYDLFVGKTLLHGDVLMWLMKTLLTSRCINQRGAGQNSISKEVARYATNNTTSEGLVANAAMSTAEFMGFSRENGLGVYKSISLAANAYTIFGLLRRPGTWRLFRYLPADYYRKVSTLSRPQLTMKIAGYGVKAKIIFDLLSVSDPSQN
ncbi:DUF4225 domain-containing protein, partial [Enterobacter intestinihominis]|uniref:DUF4225 domain-containing protein n=1 Tax=Enterobacter intestinihominis TaxID=3133180 RepID=UPI003B4325DA